MMAINRRPLFTCYRSPSKLVLSVMLSSEGPISSCLMRRPMSAKRFVVVALVLAGMLGGSATVQAQYPNYNPYIAQQQYFNNAARALSAPSAYAGSNFAPNYGAGNIY